MSVSPVLQAQRWMAMWQEACFVAALRTTMLCADACAPTAWGSREHSRMWSEKFAAARASALAAMLNPYGVWPADPRPYASRVRRNRKRLVRRATRT